MTPDEILKNLKYGASEHVQTTLQTIYNVCCEQHERGIMDFSIATIARLGANRNVPKAQSIRNKSGQKYRTLILAFAEFSSKNNNIKKIAKTQSDWIDEISSPKHQLLTRILASELKEARQIINEIIPPKKRIDIYDYRNALPIDNYKLNEQETRALQYLLSDEFKRKWNFKETEFGELIDENGTPVFKVATINALRKALEHLS